MLLGIELAKELGAPEVELIGDSQLIVRQVRGEYKVKDADLKPLREQVIAALGRAQELVDPRCPPRQERARRPPRQRGSRLLSRAQTSGCSCGRASPRSRSRRGCPSASTSSTSIWNSTLPSSSRVARRRLGIRQGPVGIDRPLGDLLVVDPGRLGEGRDLAQPLGEAADEGSAAGRLCDREQRSRRAVSRRGWASSSRSGSLTVALPGPSSRNSSPRKLTNGIACPNPALIAS